MAYGTVKVDNITFTNGGIDQTITVSGIVQSISGDITATGTIQAGTVIGTSTVSGATVTGDSGQFITATAATGVFTSTLSGATITGNSASFTTITGGTVTLASGVFASGTAAAPSVSVGTTDNGLYSPGADQLALSTNGNGRLFIDSTGRIGVGTSSPGDLATGANNFVIGGGSGSQGLTIYSGTSSNGSILFADGIASAGSSSYRGIIEYNHTNDYFYFGTAAQERLRITSAGLVGIGTTSPISYRKLTVKNDGSSGGIAITNTADDIVGQFCGENVGTSQELGIYSLSNMRLYTGGTQRATIDSSGRLLVGTSSSRSISQSATANLQLEGTSWATTGISITTNSNDAFGSRLIFGKSRSAAVGGSTVVQSNDFLGGIRFAGADGADIQTIAAEVTCQVDGTPGADDMPGRLVFSTTADGASSPTERMRIDNSGFISLGGDTNTGFSNPSADNLAITTGGSERARIDSSGRLLVGTSTARANFYNSTGTAQIQVEGTNFNNSSISITTNSATDNDAGNLIISKSGGASIGSNTLVANNEAIGGLVFNGNDGTEFVTCAAISALIDGTPGANDMPGRLVFSTTADGASSPTERLSIGNQGYIFPDNTSRTTAASVQATGSGGFKIISSSLTTTARCECFTDSTATRYGIVFSNPNGIIGSISTSASATAFNTSSDYRLKENVTPVTDGITRLQQLKPSRFNFIADPTKTVDGFLAHEVQTIVPEAITGEKDAVDDDGNPVYQGIDQSKLVPLLTAALQEAVAKIESLEARLTAAGI